MGKQSRKRRERRIKRQRADQDVAPAPVPVSDIATVKTPADLTDCLDDHCDDYIDDPAAPAVLRAYLAFARAPAHGLLLPRPHPRLFADRDGQRVRVTMASRLGDVGITTNLAAESGYQLRVLVRQLSNFSEEP